MAAPYTQIKRKVNDVFEELLNSHGGGSLDGLTIFKGFSGAKLTVPRLEIIADKATPEKFDDVVTGNWLVELKVAIVTNYKNTTRQVHTDWVGVVEDIFMREEEELLDIINNQISVVDFTLQEFDPGAQEDLTDGKNHKTITEAMVTCAPSVFEDGVNVNHG